eukprot:4082142-Pyramimonas_sp.AAC.1
MRAWGDPALDSCARMGARARVWSLKWKGDPPTFQCVFELWRKAQSKAKALEPRQTTEEQLSRLISALPDRAPG